jgi:hypothetical protein
VESPFEYQANAVACCRVTAPFKDLSFADLLDLSTHGDFHMDAYAQRGLILSPPAASTLLSSLHVSVDEFLQRYAITAHSGEQMVITFRLQLEDSLVFLRWAADASGISGEGVEQISPVWQ